jgi:hypothetical protein
VGNVVSHIKGMTYVRVSENRVLKLFGLNMKSVKINVVNSLTICFLDHALFIIIIFSSSNSSIG